MSTWADLTKGTWIVCPSDGRREKVTRIYAYRRGFVFVRTTRHDHVRRAELLVEVTEGQL